MLAYGTALGVHREKSLISYDDDDFTGLDTDVSLSGDSPDTSCFDVREGKLFSV
jgi:hypothetical protein